MYNKPYFYKCCINIMKTHDYIIVALNYVDKTNKNVV